MRRALAVGLAWVCLYSSVRAEEPPDPVAAAARAVVRLAAAADEPGLRARAARTEPDPWLVAEELFVSGHPADALAFAGETADLVRGPLRLYLSGRRARETDAADRRHVRAARRALAPGAAPTPAIRPGDRTLDAVLAIESLHLAARGLAGRERHADAAAAFERVSTAAIRMAWRRRGLEAAQAAVAMRRRGPSKDALARALYELGRQQKLAGNLERALATMTEALAVREAVGGSQATVRLLTAYAAFQTDLGRHHESLATLARATALAEEADDAEGLAEAGLLRGSALRNLGRYEAAQEALEQAYDQASKQGNGLQLARCCNIQAAVYQRINRPDLALVSAREALTHSEAIGAKTLTGSAHATIGSILRTQDEYADALEHLEHALRIHAEVGHRMGRPITLMQIGLVMERIGQPAKALRYHRLALAEFEAMHMTVQVMGALGNTAMALFRLGEHEDALRRLERSRELAGQMDDRTHYRVATANLGELHRRLGNLQQARPLILESMALSKEAGAHMESSVPLTHMGMLAAAEEDHVAALAWHKQALAAAETARDRRETVGALNNCAIVHQLLGQLDEADACVVRMAEILEQVPNPIMSLQLDRCAGLIQLRRGRCQAAIDRFLSAARRAATLSAGLGVGEGASTRDTWKSLFDTALYVSHECGAPMATALFLEYERAMSLREGLYLQEVSRTTRASGDLLRELDRARRAERSALVALQALGLSVASEQQQAGRERYAQARLKTQRVIERVQAEAKETAAFVLPAPDHVIHIRSRLKPDEALVLYFRGQVHGLQALVLDWTRVESIQLVAPDDLPAFEARLAAAFPGQPPYVDTGAIDAIRRTLIDKLGLGSHVKRVLVSPTGRLGYVPISLLVPQIEVAYVPSGTVHGLLLAQGGERGTGVLGVGDPDTTSRHAIDRMPRLPAGRAEVEAFATRRLIGSNATLANLGRVIGTNARWRAIHFACHAVVDPAHPLQSFLALTPTADHAGRLDCMDVFRLETPADLIVLSACETGRGRAYEAEGIVGLTSAFMHTGAPRVLCSLWKVDDAATRALMERFYALWNPHPEEGASPGRAERVEGASPPGLGAAAALKQAQAHVRDYETAEVDRAASARQGRTVRRRTRPWAHPKHWAAWVLWGLPE